MNEDWFHSFGNVLKKVLNDIRSSLDMYIGGPHIVQQNGRNWKSYYEKFVLFQIEYREVAKTVLCETISHY